MTDSESQITNLYVRWPNGDKVILHATDVTDTSHKALMSEIQRQLGPKPQCLLFAVK